MSRAPDYRLPSRPNPVLVLRDQLERAGYQVDHGTFDTAADYLDQEVPVCGRPRCLFEPLRAKGDGLVCPSCGRRYAGGDGGT